MSARASVRGGADFDAGPLTERFVVWDHARHAHLLRGGEVALFITRDEAEAAVKAAGLRLTTGPAFRGAHVELAEPDDWGSR